MYCIGILCDRPQSGAELQSGGKKKWYMVLISFTNKKQKSVVCKSIQPPWVNTL